MADVVENCAPVFFFLLLLVLLFCLSHLSISSLLTFLLLSSSGKFFGSFLGYFLLCFCIVGDVVLSWIMLMIGCVVEWLRGRTWRLRGTHARTHSHMIKTTCWGNKELITLCRSHAPSSLPGWKRETRNRPAQSGFYLLRMAVNYDLHGLNGS